MKKIKIATIGGGSSYTPELIEGFIKRSDRLNISEICLVDIKEGEEKLNIVGELARRMIKKAGLDWKLTLTLDIDEALKDADFVTTQFRVGLLPARIKDERIPLSHGLIGQETNGAGGIFKAFRTIPVILNIVEKMKTLCPNAWLINFTNPAGMVSEAAIKYGNWKKTIGLCNVPLSSISLANRLLGREDFDDRLFFKFGGLNHFHWHRIWNENGDEITNMMIEEIFSDKNQGKVQTVANIKELPFVYEQVKDLGVIPCTYHRYYYLTDEMLKEELEGYENHQTRGETVLQTENELFELYKDKDLAVKPAQLAKRGGAHYSDAACEVITSIVNDARNIMVVDTINNGALDDLDDDVVVEVSSVITSHGPEPLNIGKLPKSCRGALVLQKEMEECVIEAAVKGDYGKAIQAFTLNPLIMSGNEAKELLDEMLIANEAYLPQFKEVIEKLKKA